MSCRPLFPALVLALLLPMTAPAQNESQGDEAPPISITSPDTGTTFAFGTLKSHTLYWDKSHQVLIARLSFVDENNDMATQSSDTHDFRIPGISFDEAKGVFTATTAKGEVIPVAHIKKVLFIKTVETLPNAAVRVLHPRGNITVILEAISPDDPAMHPHPDGSNPDGTRKVDINQLVN